MVTLARETTHNVEMYTLQVDKIPVVSRNG